MDWLKLANDALSAPLLSSVWSTSDDESKVILFFVFQSVSAVNMNASLLIKIHINVIIQTSQSLIW
jgi:hypothetical protein